jgi:predicted regulator of Ras-like GTPase activity (Roadblock/LC7/MglB family)
MDDVLANLTRVRGVGGALLVSADGEPIAAQLRQGVDEAALSAAAGELIGAGVRLAGGLNLGQSQSFTGSSELGSLIVLAAGPAWLVILAEAGANLALLQIEAKPQLDRLASRLAL